MTQNPRIGLSASHPGSWCKPSSHGTPAVAIRHDAKWAVQRSMLTNPRAAVAA